MVIKTVKFNITTKKYETTDEYKHCTMQPFDTAVGRNVGADF